MVDYADLNNNQKSAILLLSLDETNRKELFRNLTPYDRDKILVAISDVEVVDSGTKERVLREFFKEVVTARGGVMGGKEKVKEILNKSLSKAEASEIISKLDLAHGGGSEISSVLKTVDLTQLTNFLHGEQPQTIALILSLLDPSQAAQVVSSLPEEQQPNVVMRLATMGQTDPEIIAQIGHVVKTQLSSSIGQQLSKGGGAESVASILNYVDRATEKAILTSMEEQDPDIAEEVRKKMFVFDDLVSVEDRSMQRILKEIDTSELSMALKSASEKVKNHVFKNISKRAAELIKEEIEYMGPVRLRDVEEAQQKIVNVVRRLEEEGEVVIAGRGGAGDEFV